MLPVLRGCCAGYCHPRRGAIAPAAERAGVWRCPWLVLRPLQGLQLPVVCHWGLESIATAGTQASQKAASPDCWWAAEPSVVRIQKSRRLLGRCRVAVPGLPYCAPYTRLRLRLAVAEKKKPRLKPAQRQRVQAAEGSWAYPHRYGCRQQLLWREPGARTAAVCEGQQKGPVQGQDEH